MKTKTLNCYNLSDLLKKKRMNNCYHFVFCVTGNCLNIFLCSATRTHNNVSIIFSVRFDRHHPLLRLQLDACIRTNVQTGGAKFQLLVSRCASSETTKSALQKLRTTSRCSVRLPRVSPHSLYQYRTAKFRSNQTTVITMAMALECVKSFVRTVYALHP